MALIIYDVPLINNEKHRQYGPLCWYYSAQMLFNFHKINSDVVKKLSIPADILIFREEVLGKSAYSDNTTTFRAELDNVVTQYEQWRHERGAPLLITKTAVDLDKTTATRIKLKGNWGKEARFERAMQHLRTNPQAKKVNSTLFFSRASIAAALRKAESTLTVTEAKKLAEDENVFIKSTKYKRQNWIGTEVTNAFTANDVQEAKTLMSSRAVQLLTDRPAFINAVLPEFSWFSDTEFDLVLKTPANLYRTLLAYGPLYASGYLMPKTKDTEGVRRQYFVGMYIRNITDVREGSGYIDTGHAVVVTGIDDSTPGTDALVYYIEPNVSRVVMQIPFAVFVEKVRKFRNTAMGGHTANLGYVKCDACSNAVLSLATVVQEGKVKPLQGHLMKASTLAVGEKKATAAAIKIQALVRGHLVRAALKKN